MKKRIHLLFVVALFIVALSACGQTESSTSSAETKDTVEAAAVVADGLIDFTVSGETDLPGNFYLSFVRSRDLILLDGKGAVVWSKHEDQPSEGAATGLWDFKKHDINGTVYYSYHDQTGTYDNYGLEGYAPGERVILDEDFNEIKRITFEQSDETEQGAPLDGHDFLMIDLDHYILSGYIKDTVYNVPDHPNGSSVVYSYLQEVQNGKVIWEWKSIDYPELYSLTVTDASETANDFANQNTDVPDYVHFNSMRLNEDGDLICSFRHINSILCLDRTAKENQILWKLSGNGDEFGLSDAEKTSSQHYATIDGNYITVFDNGNKTGLTCLRSYLIDPTQKTAAPVRTYSFNNKFSFACGSAQHITDEIYVIGWGAAIKDTVCMSVYNFSTGKELMSVSLSSSQDATYRCVYYE